MASARAFRLLLVHCCVIGGVACNVVDAELPDDPFGEGSGGSAGQPAAVGKGGSSSGAGGRSSATGGQPGSTDAGGTERAGGSVESGEGGAQATGSGEAAGGKEVGGSRQAGGAGAAGLAGARQTGGSKQRGGSSGAGGAKQVGGASSNQSAGDSNAGGTPGAGGAKQVGGASNAGGAPGAGGVQSSGAGGTSGGQGGCDFTVTSSTSTKIPTVGIVEWSSTLDNMSSANIVYTLKGAGADVLNTGGTAPVDLKQAKNRTLLLGLKPSSTYNFHIEATSAGGGTCKSPEYSVTTGAATGAPTIRRTAAKPTAQAKGFVLTCGGISGNMPAVIIDADGAVVWWTSAPGSCSRIRMSYEATDMWLLASNATNGNGEMRRVSMDGLTSQNNVTGLSKAHHDFTVLPGGIVAAMAWNGSGSDPESQLLERSADGTVKTAFRIGSNVYPGGQSALGGGSNTYHANSISYNASDDSYIIGDRNPNLYVKVSRSGQPIWQFGGNCSNAAAPQCVAGTWTTNHGHHLLDNGNFVFFNNGPFGSTSTPSRVYEFALSTSGSSMSATQMKSYASSSNNHSDSLGDVQRLPNGNTLVTFSNNGLIQELDSSWTVVQTLSASSFGYADWRETLYGPPAR